MKRALEQMALRVPLLGSVVARRALLLLQGRALLRRVGGPSARARLQGLQRDLAQRLQIDPIFVAGDRRSFLEASARVGLPELAPGAPEALRAQGAFELRRFCLCCNETTSMRVDYQFCRVEQDGSRTPNWRERLVCSRCGMNNRQRLVAKLVQQLASRSPRPSVYLMEQVTPIYAWVRRLPGALVQGSEYLGYEYKGGERVNGVRHEDAMRLSYPDAAFDVIVSNDVLEHIPDPAQALRECFRVLKPGGTVLATFPFHAANDASVVRARLVDGAIEHLLVPAYHGNPAASEGCLVFTDFGWDLLDVMRDAGLSPWPSRPTAATSTATWGRACSCSACASRRPTPSRIPPDGRWKPSLRDRAEQRMTGLASATPNFRGAPPALSAGAARCCRRCSPGTGASWPRSARGAGAAGSCSSS